MQLSIPRRWLGLAKFAGLCVMLAAGFTASAQEGEEEFPHGDFVEDCTQCHSPNGWRPAVIGPDFNHDERGFALRGSHRQAACRACHATLEFRQAPTECAACHLDVHRNELGSDCGRCHTSRSFIDRAQMVRSHLATRFPLHGTHRAIDCEDCHRPQAAGALQWVNTATECRACHLEDFLATASPDHQAGGFPQTCEQCHSEAAWHPAGFNHNTLASGIACVSCHLQDYLDTTDPDHQAAAFPQACDLCHSTVSWKPTTADGTNHDALFFPIFSGKHRGKWSSCNDCHTTGSFQQFSCIDCHKHDNENEVTNQHDEVSGFQYNSQACLACHPQGRE